MKRLGVDIDGVLANFFIGYENLIVEIAGEDKFPKDTLPPTWNWPEHYGYSKEIVAEAWKRIKTSEDFWLGLPALPGADQFLQRLSATKHEVYFITDRPGNNPQWQSANWLWVGGYEHAAVIVTGGQLKSVIANALQLDVFIDDKPGNIMDLAECFLGRTFMLAYPYNAHTAKHAAGPFTTVGSLDEFWKEASL